MQKFNYLFFIFACVVGVLVLSVSLQSANKQRATSEQNKLLMNKLYVAREILPDHTLYPLLMIVDRVRLELVEPEQRSSLLVAYAKRRLFYSERLLAKNQRELSFITLSKAIAYHQQALQLSIDAFSDRLFSHRLNQELAFMVMDSQPELLAFVAEHRSEYSDSEQVTLDLMLEQSKFLMLDLQEIINR
jgi:hypothetical protein